MDFNCNWLPVCPIYVNDCIYECMNASNLEVSPHNISHTARRNSLVFGELIRALKYDKLEGTKKMEIVWQ